MATPGARILTLNAGSSSLRFCLFEATGKRGLEGKFERIGKPNAALGMADEKDARPVKVDSHHACLPILESLLKERKAGEPAVVAHRVVHGGPDHFDPARVTPALLDELRAIEDFAPNHLPAAIALMADSLGHWPDIPQLACFDTAFHRDLPVAARLLPLPRRYVAQGLRRYGFHGLSFTSVMAELGHRSDGRHPSRVVLAHLGHGASLASVRDGRCVDTTMGFTPIGGIPMSTRTGDLDPGALAWLLGREKLSAEQLEELVSKRSGLLGLSETSSDTRELLERERNDARVAEALAVFVHGVRKAIGAGAAVLGGLEALAFSGGIGENSAELRTRICADFEYLGLRLDPARNADGEGLVSRDDSRVAVHVIQADEEGTLAAAAREFLGQKAGG